MITGMRLIALQFAGCLIVGPKGAARRRRMGRVEVVEGGMN